MKVKTVIGSAAATGLLGLGILTGSVIGSGSASAQSAGSVVSSVSYSVAAQVATAQPTVALPQSSTKATITQAQAEAAALAASPGNTVDHTRLGNENGVAAYDVDFANGGGVIINAETGAVIASEAAGADTGGGRGGHGGGGADQAALAAKATVSQADAEKAALAASPGNTVDHSRLGDNNGTIFWDVDFSNGGGVTVNALTGAVIATEAAGTDGGHNGGPAQIQP